VFETTQATKEKVGQVKDHAASTFGASVEKPDKNDVVQYDVAQEKYDFGTSSILEQLK